MATQIKVLVDGREVEIPTPLTELKVVVSGLTEHTILPVLPHLELQYTFTAHELVTELVPANQETAKPLSATRSDYVETGYNLLS